jgi:hypothetical protein
VDYPVDAGDVAGAAVGAAVGAGAVAGAAVVVANVPCPCAGFQACVVKVFHHHENLCDQVASAWVVAGVPYSLKRLARADD